jgi:hypothetical protein
MKEKILYHGIPIAGRMPLFNAENRQAVRDDRKEQTRRPMKSQPTLPLQFMGANSAHTVAYFGKDKDVSLDDAAICPYGTVGDVRCMCEPLMRGATTGVAYYLDNWRLHWPTTPVISLITGKPIPWRWKRDTLTSIHMPTEAARTVCRVTDIRVERVQDITFDGMKAEGLYSTIGYGPIYYEMWQELWNSIYAKRGYGFAVNPHVWVNVFEKVV